MGQKETRYNYWAVILTLLLITTICTLTYSQATFIRKVDSIGIYIDHHSPSDAIQLINQIRHEDKNITKKQQLELDIYKTRALILAELFDEALQLSQKTLQENNLTPTQLIKINNSRALIFEFFNNYKEAQNCLDQVQSIFKKNKSLRDRTYSNYLIRQSSLYRIQSKELEDSEHYNLFIAYAQKAYQFAKEQNHPIEEGVACMLLGFNTKYSLLKRKLLYEKSLHTFETINDKHGKAAMLTNIADLEQNQQHNQRAINLLKKAEKEIESTKLHSLKAYIYRKMSTIYENMGRNNESYKYFKKFHQANQEYNYVQKDIKISELNNSFLLSKEKIKKDAIKQKLDQTKSNNTKLIILSSILILGTFALINFALKLRKTQDELFLQKEFLEEKSIIVRRSLNEKEILLRELNHRVRNNLALIISLAQFHIKEIEDPIYKEQFQQFENRLQSICYAHDLYIYELNNDRNNRVFLRDYIKKIITGLIAINTKEIHSDSFIENLSLNIETALPIGIIVNELITNTIKHAKPPKNQEAKFTLTISKTDNAIQIDYFDNGEIEKDKTRLNKEKQDSLGLFILKNMVKQLFGNLEVKNYHYKIKLRPKSE